MAGFFDALLFKYRTIIAGAALPARSALAFTGAGVTVADDPINDQTTVTISGGGGGAVTWANDLTGSTDSHQYVAAISGNAGGGGNVALNGVTLRWSASSSSPTIKQADQTGASTNGQTLQIQAQNATGTTSTGGKVQIVSGTGTTAAGDVEILNGATTIAKFQASGAVVELDTPTFKLATSAGTLVWTITSVAASACALTMSHIGSTYTISQSDQTANSTAGKTLTIQSQNATGTSSAGGDLTLSTGTGTSNAGAINLQLGGSTIAKWSGSTSTPLLTFTQLAGVYTISQSDQTASSTNGKTLTLQAQNATGITSTGGALALTSGTGTTAAGNVELQTGGTAQWRVTPSLLINVNSHPIEFGTASTMATTGHIRWGDLGSSMVTLMATHDNGSLDEPIIGVQTSTSYKLAFGDGVSGTAGTAWSSIDMAASTVNIWSVNTSGVFIGAQSSTVMQFTTANNTALKATFYTTTLAPTINQTTIATNSATGQTMTIQAQNASGTTSNGGPLVLTSGTGTSADGSVSIQTGGNNRIVVSSTIIGTTKPLGGSSGDSSTFKFLRQTPNFLTDANMTLAAAQYAGVILDVTSSGILGATRDVVVPGVEGTFYIVFNNTTGGQSIRIIAGLGTGITIANGKRAIVYNDGTNYVRVTPDT